jgi:hypothetical protein
MTGRLLCVFSLLALLIGQPALAGHNSGLNISYECLGGDDYLITVYLFRDCSDPTPAPSDLNVFIYSGCDNLGFISFPLTSSQEVSQLCPSALPNSTCNGGSEPGVQLNVYQETVNLEPCFNWRIVVAEQNRTVSVNLLDPALNRIHVEAFLNNTGPGCNNSPELGVLNLPYVCVGNELLYNLGFTETDGDSLAYALVPALTSTQADLPFPMGYTGTYSGAEPITGITIDPVTGQIAVTPGAIGIFNVVVEVREYRNGVLIGIVLHDFLFLVNPCASSPPVPVAGSLSHVSGGGYPFGDLTIGICPGDDFCVSLDVSSPDPAIGVSVSSNIASVIPGASETVTGTNPATIEFCGTMPADFEAENFLVTAIDDACSVFGQAYFVVNFVEREPLIAGPDTVVCQGESVQLFAANDTLFTWTDLAGNFINPGPNFSCNPCANPVVLADSTRKYIVTGQYAGGTCANSDTVTVGVPLSLGLSQSDETCAGNDGVIQITIFTGSGVYNVNWTDIPGNSIFRNDLVAGNYEVTITDLTHNCSRTETFEIVQLSEPIANAGSDDISCGLTYQLDAIPSFGTPLWTAPAGATLDDPSDPNTLVTFAGPGSYMFIWTENAGFDCTDSDTVTVEVFLEPQLSILGADSMCGLQLPIEAVAANGVLQWGSTSGFVFDDDVAPLTEGTAAAYGDVTVFASVVNGPCEALDTLEVRFIETPVANAGTPLEVCADSAAIEAIPSVGLSTWIFPPEISLSSTENDPVNMAFANPYGLYELIWEEVNENYCVDSDTIELRFTEQPISQLPADTALCTNTLLVNAAVNVGVISWEFPTGYAGSSPAGASNEITGPYGTFDAIVTADNGFGCTDSDTMNIGFVVQPEIVPFASDTVCGFEFLLSADPIGDLNYWQSSGGVVIANPAAANTLANVAGPGIYQVEWIVENASLCADTADYTFEVFFQPEAVAGDDQVLCGLSTSLDASPSNGTFIWVDTPGLTFSDPLDPQSEITAADYGSYFVVAREFDGLCEDRDTLTVNFVSAPVILNPTFTCTGTDAEFVLSFQASLGDTANYLVSGLDGVWSGMTYTGFPLSSETLVNVVLSDGGFCGEDSFTGTLFCEVLTNAGSMSPDTLRGCGDLPVLADLPSDPVLDGNDSIVFALHTAPGAALGDVIAWSATPGFSFVAGMQYETVYYISAVVGNTDTEGVNISDPFLSVSPGTPVVFYETPQAFTTGETTACPGDSVLIELTATGALPQTVTYEVNGQTFEMSVNSNTAAILALNPGNYNLTSTSSEYCTGDASGTFVLSHFELPDAVISLNPTFCEGETTELDVSFVGAAPFDFDLLRDDVILNTYQNQGAAFSSEVGEEGLYQIAVLTDQNCQRSDTISAFLEMIPAPIADAGPDTLLCSGDTIRIGTPQVTGHTYQWNGPSGLLNENTPRPDVTANNNGFFPFDLEYTVVASMMGCSSFDTVVVSVHPLPEAQIIGPDTICAGQTVSMIGYGAPNMSWEPANLFDSPVSAQSPFSTLVPTEITLTVTSLAGCDASVSKPIEALPSPDAYFVASAGSGCAPLSVVYEAIDQDEGLTYVWQSTQGTFTTDQPAIELIYSNAGSDAPFLTVTNSFGCVDTFSLPLPIEIFSTQALFSFAPDDADITDPRVVFTNESPFGVSSVWTFDSLGTFDGRNASFVFPDEVGADYTVCLEVVSPEGCTDELCQRVVIADDFYIYVPNSFTPNGDGLNDLFGPVLSRIDVVEYRFWIVNRRGRLVFDTNDPNQKWNGSGLEEEDYFEGSNVYIWQMIAKPDFDVDTKKYIGKVLLLR